ncbi:RHS repeat-associated core domain-containing protein OS=Streptomyces microflavus OX=1919 GN=Smic_45680 PE=4 SV=1 [Streptomyces microflavus]
MSRTTSGAGHLDHRDTTPTTSTAGAKRPHAVQQASVTGGSADGRTSTFQYDDAGNTTKRTIGTTVQDLTWTPEGQLATLTEAGKQTAYTYDADGNRIIAKNGDGSSTLTLPNGDQLQLAANGTKTATRYYTHNGETVAVRNGNSIAYLINDHQGTAMTALAVGSLALTRRKQLPFGQLRSEQSSVFGPRGFVGGTNDPTGLTHLGAREYDPVLGRFVSVDPIIDFGDPAQMNAYSYAHNSPLTKSDPTGLRPDGPTGGGPRADEQWASDRGMYAGFTMRNGKWVWKQTPKKDTQSKKRYKAYQANPSTYKVRYYGTSKVSHVSYKSVNKTAPSKVNTQAASRKRQQENDTWGSIKGNLGKAWGKAKGAWDYVNTYTNTSGVCVSVGGTVGLGGELSGCLIWTKRPDGKTDFGLSGTIEEQVGGPAGVGASAGLVRSNADDFEQIRGDASGFGGTAGYGWGVTAGHRGTYGTRNSRGDIVHSFTAGVAGAAGLEGNFGSGKTGVHKLFTW